MQLLQYGIQLRDFTPEIGIETSHFRLGAMLQELFVHSISFVAFTGELAIPLLPKPGCFSSRPGKHLMRT